MTVTFSMTEPPDPRPRALHVILRQPPLKAPIWTRHVNRYAPASSRDSRADADIQRRRRGGDQGACPHALGTRPWQGGARHSPGELPKSATPQVVSTPTLDCGAGGIRKMADTNTRLGATPDPRRTAPRAGRAPGVLFVLVGPKRTKWCAQSSRPSSGLSSGSFGSFTSSFLQSSRSQRRPLRVTRYPWLSRRMAGSVPLR